MSKDGFYVVAPIVLVTAANITLSYYILRRYWKKHA
jgi:hypothetical protein